MPLSGRRRCVEDRRFARVAASVGRALDEREDESSSSSSNERPVLNASWNNGGGGGFTVRTLVRLTLAEGDWDNSRCSSDVTGVSSASPFPRITPFIAEPKSSATVLWATGVSNAGGRGGAVEVRGAAGRTGVASVLLEDEKQI